MSLDSDLDPRAHIVRELGMALRLVDEGLLGRADIQPQMCVPGTEIVRASVLATWTDVIAGLLVGQVITPRVPVTLELSVELYRPVERCRRVEATGRLLKSGRSVGVVRVDLAAEDGTPIGIGTSSFMAAPDVTLSMPPLAESLRDNHQGQGRLTMPFADRAGCVRRAPGLAELPRAADGLNASNTINGGLIALAVEEAALSLAPGATLSSLVLRYLRPARVGPVVARATAHGGLASVDVRDAGNDDRLAVAATTRTFA